VALTILELPLAVDKTAFSGCEIQVKNQEPVKMEFSDLVLQYVNINEITGSKAVMLLHFYKVEQGM
jgi:hypothetical protein